MNSVIATSWGARSRKAAQLLGGLFVVLLLCLPAFSQGSFGRILGTVTDQSGGVVSGATVSVIDTERGVTRTLTTDDAGAYNAPNLTAGNYTVRVEAKGFKRIERQGVGLEIGHEVRIDLTVQPGEQNQTVTVTESVPLVETTNATMGGTLENADIIDLPLNGRDYQNLLGLRPGVMLQPGGGPWTQSTNGVRPDQSVWMVEGVINSNFFDGRPVINMPSPFTDGATILPVDAIQEFNVMENPKAEYGWKSGAVVNVGIKSGTNQLHGDAYAFGRYQAWDARNVFNVANTVSGCPLVTNGECNKTPAQLKQFGGVVGGPIKKDKLFFFAGFEGLRSLIGFVGGIAVPGTSGFAVADPSNSMVDAINAVVAAKGAGALSPVSLKLAGCTTGPVACTGGTYFPNSGTSTNFLSTFPTINTSDNGVGKMDYHLNDKNTINGMFFYGHYNAFGEDHAFTSAPANDSTPIRAWSDTVSWVFTPSSSLVNEMRFGYDRTSFSFVNLDVGAPSNGTGNLPINTGITDPLAGGVPSVVIAGFGNGGTPVVGTAFNRPQYFTPNPYFDFQDSVSVLKGKHSFKFGGEFAHVEADSAAYNNGRGRFDFLGGKTPGLADCKDANNNPISCPLEDFFAGNLSDAQVLTGNPKVRFTWMNTAGYIQDDWRVTPKLIINLGVRYQYASPMKEANNNAGTFDPNLGMVQQGHGINSLWSGDHRDFEPRLGFAWDLTGKGTTVVRAGGSLIHESWTENTFTGQFVLQNAFTTIFAVPTAAQITCGLTGVPGVSSCPSSLGGTNSNGAATIAPNLTCWNAPPVGAGCSSGQATALPGSATPVCGDGANGAPSPCNIMGTAPNLKTPFVVNYNISITHSFGSNLSLEVAYVGNKGHKLLSFQDINQTPLGAANCLNTATTGTSLTAAQLADACGPNATGPGGSIGPACVAALNCVGNGQAIQEGRPFFNKFPYLGYIELVGNHAYSNYNSLQVSLNKRMSHGLLLTAGYTYGHGLDNGSLNRFTIGAQNSYNLKADYGKSDFDVRHRLTVTATYNIPGIKGYGQVLEGWQINTIVTYATSQPWIVFDSADNFSGTGENVDRWNITGNPADFKSGFDSFALCKGVTCKIANPYGIPQTLSAAQTTSALASCAADAVSAGTLAAAGCYVSRNGNSFLTPPALGTYGNMGRNIFPDSGFKNWDFSIFKNFKFKERYGIQARWEVFNALNHPIAANPSGASSAVNSGNGLGGGNPGLGASLLTPDFAAGNPLIGSGSQRVMQVGLKLTF